jgi:hypothetical protein
MKDCRRILMVVAALLIAVVGAARAEQESSSPHQQTSSFWSWLFPGSSPASKPRPAPAPTARVGNAAEPAKPHQNCTLLTCVTMVGVGF